jgi:hypothetical protein
VDEFLLPHVFFQATNQQSLPVLDSAREFPGVYRAF